MRISPLPEAQLQDVEDEKPAAGWVAVCLEPEGAEELRHAAGCQAGDGEPKAAQLPLQQVVDDGAEPWEKKERVLGDATLKMPPAASPRIRSPVPLSRASSPWAACHSSAAGATEGLGRRRAQIKGAGI